MKTFKITIEIIDVELQETNPFIKIGQKLQLENEQKELVRKANIQIKDAHKKILSKIKIDLIKKLESAKIPFYHYHVFDIADVQQRSSFNPIYGDFSFWISVNNKYLLVKIVPQITTEKGHYKLSGKYQLYYTSKSNAEQMKFGNAGGWVRFETTKVLEDELVKFFD